MEILTAFTFIFEHCTQWKEYMCHCSTGCCQHMAPIIVFFLAVCGLRSLMCPGMQVRLFLSSLLNSPLGESVPRSGTRSSLDVFKLLGCQQVCRDAIIITLAQGLLALSWPVSLKSFIWHVKCALVTVGGLKSVPKNGSVAHTQTLCQLESRNGRAVSCIFRLAWKMFIWLFEMWLSLV